MNKKPHYLQFLKIERNILSLNVSMNARVIFAYIEGYYNKPGNIFNSSNQFIASELNLSVDQVKRAIKELEQNNLILIKETKHIWGKSNRIIESIPYLEALAAIELFNKNYGNK